MTGVREWSLARQLLVLQAVLVGLLVAGGAVAVYLDSARQTEEAAAREATAVASSVADSPTVAQALGTADPSATLQPFAERVRADTGVDFITIMNAAGVRYTHPNPEMIGGHFLGNTEQALAGQVLTETYTGTLGPSVRAVVPVFGPNRTVTALVSAGITVDVIDKRLESRLAALAIAAVLALAVGAAGTCLVSARLRRQTGGLGPARLRSMIDYHEAILHAVREGLLLVDHDRTLRLCNDGARELLGLPENAEGRRVDELGLPEALTRTLVAQGRVEDEIHLSGRGVLVVNQSPVGQAGQGVVVTLRDHTELQALTGELDSVKGFAESLRAQAHEAANRLHTVVSLIELDQAGEAVRFATAELGVAQRLTDRVVGAVSEPVLAALLLGKAGEAHERGVELVITDDSEIDDGVLGAGPDHRDLVTILGNLIDNAIDAAADGDGRRAVSVTARRDGDDLVLRVADTGPGLHPDAARQAFDRGWSTKDSGPAGRGLGLALVGQAVRRYRGTIEVGGDSGAVFTVSLPLTEHQEVSS